MKLVNTTDLCIARSVRVKSVPDAVLATMLTSSDPLFEDSLHARLHGRIVLPGMYVSVPLLGVSSEFLITGVDTKINVEESEDSLCARRVGDSTQVVLDDAKSDNRAGGTSTKSEIPLLERLGGIHDQLSVLKPFLRDALQLVDHDAGKTSTDENHQNVNNNTDTKHTVAKGALLHGPMGSGKTTIAIAIAKWTGAHIEVIPCASLFASSDPSTSAASALQTAFARVKRRAPGIVILDDVDAVAPKRDSPNADATRIRVLATLLKLLDDLGPRSRCAVLATTIHCDNLDPAMRRPGRLDIELEIGIPSPLQRADMLLALARHSGMSLSDDDAKTAAAVGHGHVAADLASAWRMAIANSPCTANSSDTSTANKSLITARELVNAVRAVRPSALREVWVEVPTTRWSDVGGKEDAKQRLREAVEWPVSRGRLLQRLGIRPPTGVLLFGPPGCSKTLLARAVATECGANFISVKGAELLSKYVGDSEKAVRKTFERARAAAPCVIFFDEVDALASERSASAPGSGVHSRVVAQLLHEMDGIDHVHDDVVGSAQKRVVVIAATNRPDCLDSAFMRAGRIDVQVYVGLPDRTERLDILRVHTRKTPLARDVDLETLADDQYTGSFSGAEIAALVREAGLCAMERDVAHVEAIGRIDFDAALRKIRPRTSQQTMRYFEQYVRQLEEKRPY